MLLLTDRHVAYLRARHLRRHSIYKAKWLVPIAEMQNLTGGCFCVFACMCACALHARMCVCVGSGGNGSGVGKVAAEALVGLPLYGEIAEHHYQQSWTCFLSHPAHQPCH